MLPGPRFQVFGQTLSVAGVVAFIVNREILLLLSAIFFGLGGVILLIGKERTRGIWTEVIPDEDRNRFQKKIEVYQKSSILGAIGCGIGAGISWYIFGIEGHYLSIGIITGVGGAIGQLIGMMVNEKASLQSLARIEWRIHLLLGILCFILSVVGLLRFASSGEWKPMVASVFFVLCGLY